MDGCRFRTVIVLGALVLAAGCRNSKQQVAAAPGMPAPSLRERVMGTSPPGPHNIQTMAALESEPSGPVKPETVAVFADLTVETTFNNENLTPHERDRRLDEARLRFEKALQLDPKNMEALRGLGRLYTRLGDKERATQAYQAAVKHHSQNHTLAHEAAMCHGRFEDWPAALKLWQHALSLDPASRKYPRMIGLAQARLGDYESAFASLMKVCTEAEARTIMARELLDQQKPDIAMQQVEMALRLEPTYLPALELRGVQAAGYEQQSR